MCCQQQIDDYHLFVALGDGGRALAKFSMSKVRDKVPEESTLIFGDTLIS